MNHQIEIGRLLRAGTTGFIAGCRVSQFTVPALGSLVRAHLGAEPERLERGGRTHLRWTWGTPRVLVLGHLDTVWPLGTLALLRKRPPALLGIELAAHVHEHVPDCVPSARNQRRIANHEIARFFDGPAD